jgi:hypothetical protein
MNCDIHSKMNGQIEILEKAAKLLTILNKRIVFTGGSTIPLYLDELSARDARYTRDVDCVVEITSRIEYYRLSNELRQIGLEEYTGGGPLCRWSYEELIIDIMPTDPSILGFSNSWYIPGMSKSIIYTFPSSQQIRIFPIAYLLASKIEAFQGRGNDNLYTSHDMEDIALLLDGCPYLEREIQQADTKVKDFIKQWFQRRIEDIKEVASAQLSYSSKVSGREKLLLALIEKLAN